MVKHLLNLLRQPVARAIGISFFVNGFVFGAWTSCIPYVKNKLALNDAELGLLLLSMPIGVLLTNPFTVTALRRFGINGPTFVFGSLMGIAFALPVTLPGIPWVALGLFISGCVFACHNVVMNTYASNLEANHHLRLMATCHGMWSLGAMGGALIASTSAGLLAQGVQAIPPQIINSWSIALIMIFVNLAIRNVLNRTPEPVRNHPAQTKSVFSFFKPHPTLLLLASILICTYFTEGTMADWAALYMSDVIVAPTAMVGWGFGMYAGFMAAGRFIGDELIHRYSGMAVLRMGGVLVIAGMIWVILSADPWLVLPGFMLIGLGISLASPILYAASARVPDLSPGVGLATMNSFGMVAFLTGPVIIGFIARLVDLRFAFTFVLLTSTLWIIQTTRWMKKYPVVKSSA